MAKLNDKEKNFLVGSITKYNNSMEEAEKKISLYSTLVATCAICVVSSIVSLAIEKINFFNMGGVAFSLCSSAYCISKIATLISDRVGMKVDLAEIDKKLIETNNDSNNKERDYLIRKIDVYKTDMGEIEKKLVLNPILIANCAIGTICSVIDLAIERANFFNIGGLTILLYSSAYLINNLAILISDRAGIKIDQSEIERQLELDSLRNNQDEEKEKKK